MAHVITQGTCREPPEGLTSAAWDPEAGAVLHRQAQALCLSCPALKPCRAYAALFRRWEPGTVIAGRIISEHVPAAKPPRPATLTPPELQYRLRMIRIEYQEALQLARVRRDTAIAAAYAAAQSQPEVEAL